MKRGTSTPWGGSDHSDKIARGIIFYSTPSHGGYHLSPTRNAQVHEAWRRQDGWYEEDCEWSIAVLTFPQLFSCRLDADHIDQAHRTAKSHYPEAYQKVILDSNHGVVCNPFIINYKIPCGNFDCCSSSGMFDEWTFGRGKLDDYGYWEYPCFTCAAAMQKKHPDMVCWPFEKEER